MVTSAVLGAAAGTGLALLVAITIVTWRYYSAKRRGKDWNYSVTAVRGRVVSPTPNPKPGVPAEYSLSSSSHFDLSGLGGPTRSLSSRQHSFSGSSDVKATVHGEH